MTKDEIRVLHSYIDSSINYLEFGSGKSTIYASSAPSIKTIDSVESSETYINKNLLSLDVISNALTTGKLSFHIVHIGETVAWGFPKNKRKKYLWPNYSLSVFAKKRHYDLVLVDGRFRIACTLNCILNTPDSCIIMIHDFWNRPQYHIVLRYLEIKDMVDSLGVFSKKKDINITKLQSLITRYQYLPNDKTIAYQIKNTLSKCFSTRS